MLAREAAVTFGELQTVWMIRVSGLGLLLVFLIGARTPPRAPLRWWPALTVQGLTETGALFALYSGMAGEGAGLAAVTAGSSAVITALLGRIFLHEPVPLAQWGRHRHRRSRRRRARGPRLMSPSRVVLAGTTR